MTAVRSRRLIVSSTVGILQRTAQILGTLITMPLVLHALGAQAFGIWGAATSLAWMVATVDLGIGNSLLTEVARAMARQDSEEAGRQLTAALYLAATLGVVVLLAAVVILRGGDRSVPAQAYLLATGALALNIPGSLAAAAWSGLQRSDRVWAWEALQTVLTIGGLYVLTRFTADVRWYVAVTFGGLLLANLGSLAHLLLSNAALRPRRGLPSRARVLTLLRRGAPYVALGLAMTLAVHSDNIVALSILGPAAAGQMAVAQRACMTALGLLWVLTQPLWPAFTDAAVRGDDHWLRTHIGRSAALVIVAALGGSVLIVMFGRPLLQLWLHGGLMLDQQVLWAMAVWIIVPALGRIPDVLLNALGVVWFQVAVAIVYSALTFALKLALAPRLGIAGILLATGIGYGLTHLPAYVWWLRRWLRQGDGQGPRTPP